MSHSDDLTASAALANEMAAALEGTWQAENLEAKLDMWVRDDNRRSVRFVANYECGIECLMALHDGSGTVWHGRGNTLGEALGKALKTFKEDK